MKVIELPADYDDANDMFGLYRTAAFSGVAPENIEETRKLGKLQDLLDDISYEVDVPKSELPEGRDSDTRWKLNEGVRSVHIEDAHHALLKKRIFGAGIPWVASVSRKLVAAYDLVDNAEEFKKVTLEKDEEETA